MAEVGLEGLHLTARVAHRPEREIWPPSAGSVEEFGRISWPCVPHVGEAQRGRGRTRHVETPSEPKRFTAGSESDLTTSVQEPDQSVCCG